MKNILTSNTKTNLIELKIKLSKSITWFVLRKTWMLLIGIVIGRLRENTASAWKYVRNLCYQLNGPNLSGNQFRNGKNGLYERYLWRLQDNIHTFLLYRLNICRHILALPFISAWYPEKSRNNFIHFSFSLSFLMFFCNFYNYKISTKNWSEKKLFLWKLFPIQFIEKNYAVKLLDYLRLLVPQIIELLNVECTNDSSMF